jgi:hypothetical protein
MAEAYPGTGEPRKKSNTALIITIVVLVALCLCCGVILLFYFYLGDILLQWLIDQGMITTLKLVLPV